MSKAYKDVTYILECCECKDSSLPQLGDMGTGHKNVLNKNEWMSGWVEIAAGHWCCKCNHQ